MYKLIRRYYGELCDKEKQDDTEVFDEEVLECGDKEYLEKVQNSCLQDDLNNGYVVDDEEKDIYRLFFEKQENWNNYIEMFVVEEMTEIDEELMSVAEDYREIPFTDLQAILLRLEDKYSIHYQELYNRVAEFVILKELKEFEGEKNISNKEYMELVRNLENEFECDIDYLMGYEIRFKVK
jgi:hypothetical protein